MRVLAAAVALLAGGVAAAGASAAWQPAQTLGRGSAAGRPVTAQGPGGRIAAGWTLRSSTPRSATRLMQVARAGPAGHFGAPLTLDRTAHSLDDPAIAFEPDGRLDAVWRRFVALPGRRNGGNHRLWYRRLATSGALGEIEHLSGAGESAYDPLFATRPGEDPVLTWSRRTPPSWVARFAGGHAIDRRRLPGGSIFNTRAAVGGGGGVLLTWRQAGVRAAYRPAGSTRFDPPVQVPGGEGDVLDPRPVFTGTGRMAVAFSRRVAGSYRLRLAVAPAGGRFAPAEELTGEAETALRPRPVALAGGEIDIAYLSREPGLSGRVRAGVMRLVRASGETGAKVGGARLLDRNATRARSLEAAADAGGGGFAAWWLDGQVRAVRFAPGGLIGAMRRLTSRGERASESLSLSAGATTGDALVAWTTERGAVRAAVYRRRP